MKATERKKKPARRPAKSGAESSSGLIEKQLKRYREMRDFHETAEPRGRQPAAGAAPAAGLPYLIQKHAATRLHYDFRLGLHGVLKSWAVTKGPSYVPADKRLAVQVEDHPMEYGGFEGTIPKGQYGGGTVMLWDQGTWEPLGDADEGLAKGNLKFILHGKKLKGKWVLVRMGGRAAQEAKPNWLLIKEHDEYEKTPQDIPIVESAPDSVVTQRDLEGIAHAADHVWNSNRPETSQPKTSQSNARRLAGRRAAAATEPVAAFHAPKLLGRKERLPEFIPPALAAQADAVPSGADWVHELKLDGYRIQAHIETTGKKREVRLFTRKGLNWSHRMPAIVKELAQLSVEDAILDGEVVVLTDSGQSSFAELQAAFDEGKPSDLVYFAFDLLHLNGHNLREQPLSERKQVLADLLATLPSNEIVRVSQHVEARGELMFSEACRLGAEGVVSKRISSPYRSGRSASWIKVKCGRRQEFVIGGFTLPTNGSRGVGALLLGYHDGGKLQYAGRTGTGFTQTTSRMLRDRLEALEQKKIPFAEVPADGRRGAIWTKPSLVAEVQFTTWTADHRVRQASFKGLREDKAPAEVRREEPDPKLSQKIREQEPAETAAAPLKTAPSKKTAPGKAGAVSIRVTHPEKVIDPETKLTKQALVDYYLAVAPHMLPHVLGRPLSLVRCPDGAGKQCFYQKHLGQGMPAGVDGVEIPNKNGEGSETYVSVKNAEGLAGLAQMNVLEVHPWGSTTDDLEHPNRIIFNLDPDEAVSWRTLCDGALEVRERLGKLRLKSFVKTTGGKGLHIVAPIRQEHDWELVKAFTRAFTLQMERDNSKLYISKMTKAARKNKIFVDYMRNERGATAVAPYSSRARVGISAAIPLAWTELKAAARPRFLIADFADWKTRLRRDPWKEMLKIDQQIPPELFPAT